MQPTTRKLTSLALAATTLLAPLGAGSAEAGLFDKLLDKAKDKFREVTRPQYLLGKLADKLGKKGRRPAPALAPPPVVAVPAVVPAPRSPAPVARNPFAGRRPGTRVKPQPVTAPDRTRDCAARFLGGSFASRSKYNQCVAAGSSAHPVVATTPAGKAADRELGLQLLRQAERLLGQTFTVAGVRAARASDKVITRKLAAFRKQTRLDGAAWKGRSLRRMSRLRGRTDRTVRELAGDAEGARARPPKAVTKAEEVYAQLELAAREAALQATVETFRKARRVAMGKARELIKEYGESLDEEARAKKTAEYEKAISRSTSRSVAEKLARAAFTAAKRANAEKLAEFREATLEEALETARDEAWEAGEEAYAKAEEEAYEVAVEIDELMNVGEGEPSKSAQQQARVAEREARRKLQATAKDTAGVFGLGFQGSPTE